MAFNLFVTRTVPVVNVKPNFTSGAYLGSYQPKPSFNFSPILTQNNRAFSNAYADREKALEDMVVKKHEEEMAKKRDAEAKKEKSKEGGKEKEKSKEGKDKDKPKEGKEKDKSKEGKDKSKEGKEKKKIKRNNLCTIK